MTVLQNYPDVFLCIYNFVKFRYVRMTKASMMVYFPRQSFRLKLISCLDNHLPLTPVTREDTFVRVIVWCAKYTFPKEPTI
jgi:hypothetical protein